MAGPIDPSGPSAEQITAAPFAAANLHPTAPLGAAGFQVSPHQTHPIAPDCDAAAGAGGAGAVHISGHHHTPIGQGHGPRRGRLQQHRAIGIDHQLGCGGSGATGQQFRQRSPPDRPRFRQGHFQGQGGSIGRDSDPIRAGNGGYGHVAPGRLQPARGHHGTTAQQPQILSFAHGQGTPVQQMTRAIAHKIQPLQGTAQAAKVHGPLGRKPTAIAETQPIGGGGHKRGGHIQPGPSPKQDPRRIH